jgi:hypothetical protein
MARKGRAASGSRSGPRLHPEALPRGERVAGAKMTESLVREARRLASTMGCVAIARSMGVSHGTISRILSGQAWTHVGGES